eukprot:4395645-Amphidinium_carterae.1
MMQIEDCCRRNHWLRSSVSLVSPEGDGSLSKGFKGFKLWSLESPSNQGCAVRQVETVQTPYSLVKRFHCNTDNHVRRERLHSSDVSPSSKGVRLLVPVSG